MRRSLVRAAVRPGKKFSLQSTAENCDTVEGRRGMASIVTVMVTDDVTEATHGDLGRQHRAATRGRERPVSHDRQLVS